MYVYLGFLAEIYDVLVLNFYPYIKWFKLLNVYW
jgi:hypothetical protein